MRPRDVLAENLKKLMAAEPTLRTIEMLVAAGAGTTGTLDRIKRKESATGVDNLEPLARAFGLAEPWRLLVPTLNASTGPDGQLVVSGMPEWPFPKVPRELWEALDEADKGYVQRVLLEAIQRCHADQGEQSEQQEAPPQSVEDVIKSHQRLTPAKHRETTGRRKV